MKPVKLGVIGRVADRLVHLVLIFSRENARQQTFVVVVALIAVDFVVCLVVEVGWKRRVAFQLVKLVEALVGKVLRVFT